MGWGLIRAPGWGHLEFSIRGADCRASFVLPTSCRLHMRQARAYLTIAGVTLRMRTMRRRRSTIRWLETPDRRHLATRRWSLSSRQITGGPEAIYARRELPRTESPSPRARTTGPRELMGAIST